MTGFNVSTDFENLGQVQLQVRKIKMATLENASKVLLAKMPNRFFSQVSSRGRVGTLNLVA